MTIDEISGRGALRRFMQFQAELYKGVDAFVPPMIESEIDCLDPEVNPAFDFCEVVCYMARRDGRVVGRAAGIVNRLSNERVGRKQCRFCYVDFIDDEEVSRALLDRVAAWGRSKGMDELVGPLGLTDLDYEGCLVEGFDQLSTTVDLYNYPYYARHFEAYGMRRDAYWNEYHFNMCDEVPEKHRRVAELVKQRYGLRVLKFTDAKTLVKQYGHRLFELYNSSYSTLYGFTPLTDRQIDYYIKLYLPQIRLDLVRIVTDADDNLLAFGIACPSLSRAQQKARGRMWPLGWLYLAKTMYMTRTSLWGRLLGGGTDTCDLLLMGVRPDMQGKGVNALIFTELIPQMKANGYRYVESNNELETNRKISNLWGDFDVRINKRRCTFCCSINN